MINENDVFDLKYDINKIRKLFTIVKNWCFIHTEKLSKRSLLSLSRMVRMIGDEFLTEERDRKYYADHYTCCPPPLFIILITLVEVSDRLYVINVHTNKSIFENDYIR